MMRGLAFALALLAVGGATAQAQTYLGVVEENTGGGALPQLGSAILRVTFVKDGDGWRVAEQGVEHSSWTVGFDGRVVGQITSPPSTPSNMAMARGVRRIVPDGQAPRIGAPSIEYAGWFGDPVHRPLVATSSDHVEDPEQWRRIPARADARRTLRRAFRARFPHAENCANRYENAARPWAYRDNSIEISATYGSNKGWLIATARLGGYNCDGPISDPSDPSSFAAQVFALSPDGNARFLGEGMWLVDAGDYDNDGASDLVFAISRYNRGGYELFSSDFAEHATFSFSYH